MSDTERLRERIGDLEEKVERLQARVNELSDLEEMYQRVRDERDLLGKKVEELREERDRLRAEVERLRARVAELEKTHSWRDAQKENPPDYGWYLVMRFSLIMPEYYHLPEGWHGVATHGQVKWWKPIILPAAEQEGAWMSEEWCFHCDTHTQCTDDNDGYPICSNCRWIGTIKDAARKRPPTEKPDENENEFLAKIIGSLWLATYNHDEEKWSNGPCCFKDHQVEWWVPIKHLVNGN